MSWSNSAGRRFASIGVQAMPCLSQMHGGALSMLFIGSLLCLDAAASMGSAAGASADFRLLGLRV